MKPQNLILILILIGCVGPSPRVEAVNPPPDGGYPGFNTAEGQNALLSLTTGAANTAVGWFSLRTVTAGSFNTAIGAGTLLANTADENTATGAAALLSNTTGYANTANGSAALSSNTEGFQNTANGVGALLSNVSGDYNTAVGLGALRSNTNADNNTAIGINTLLFNATGVENTACGANALLSNTDGDRNTATGFDALYFNTTGGFNTAIGHSAGSNLTTGHGNVCIGASVIGVAGESGITRIRNIGSTPLIGTNVVIADTGGNGDHILGYAVSSRRYKQEIKPMDKASESLFGLKPVTFRAKGNTGDSARVKHYGLIAEDVATVDPDLVVFNPEGKPETLRFNSINAMLLNEFLKEHRTVQKLKSVVAKQEAIAAQQQKQIEALTAGLQKVSAQLEASTPAPQVAKNDY
jgi:hypothetical protein